MNLPYLVPRVIRHILPDPATRFLLRRSVIIKPGLETVDAGAAVARYAQVLASRGTSLAGKSVLVFGYGGRFDLGLGLLDAGARHVVLCDRYAPPDDENNKTLVDAHPRFLRWDGTGPRPEPQYATLLQGDVRDETQTQGIESVDLVVSTSVLEHVDDPDGSVQALRQLTHAGGMHVHFVDLRDHFFRYPFEMLHYSERTWRAWLNPSSNHNRYRLWDYRRVFEANFEEVEIEILEDDVPAFETASSRIRPEYISGNLKEDAATLIRVAAAKPRP
jgi:2-polyprenyl-3-methyl-5-hydroxy-6-metoxy-1,4-benzoquinol methylase